MALDGDPELARPPIGPVVRLFLSFFASHDRSDLFYPIFVHVS
jgi:hypothetical protein